jgi:hypothetical protein
VPTAETQKLAIFRPDNRFLVIGAIWFVAYWGARLVLERPGGEPWLRILVAVAPIPVFAWFLYQFIRTIRSLDELERRIHLEAMAIAFPLGILLLQTLGLIQRAVPLKFEDWSYAHVWIYLPIFYFLSIMLVRKRYT